MRAEDVDRNEGSAFNGKHTVVSGDSSVTQGSEEIRQRLEPYMMGLLEVVQGFAKFVDPTSAVVKCGKLFHGDYCVDVAVEECRLDFHLFDFHIRVSGDSERCLVAYKAA